MLWFPNPPRIERETEPNANENEPEEIEFRVSLSCTGSAVTSKPEFSLSVPRMNSEFLGLMQNSCTLILLLVIIPWRPRKPRTLLGAGSFVVKNESQNCSSKSQCRSRSAPRGLTSTRPVLSSTKNGTCMHSPATFTHCLFLPLCLYSQTSRSEERRVGKECR